MESSLPLKLSPNFGKGAIQTVIDTAIKQKLTWKIAHAESGSRGLPQPPRHPA